MPQARYTRIEMLRVVIRVTGVSEEQLKSRRRLAHISFARQIYYWLSRRFVRVSYISIASLVRRTHHTTIMSGIDVIAAFARELDGCDPETCARTIWLQRPTNPLWIPAGPSFNDAVWADHLIGFDPIQLSMKYQRTVAAMRMRISRIRNGRLPLTQQPLAA